MAVNAYDSEQDALMQDHLQYQQELQHLIQSQGRYMNSPQQKAYQHGLSHLTKEAEAETKKAGKIAEEFKNAGMYEYYEKFFGGDQKDEKGNVTKEGLDSIIEKVTRKTLTGAIDPNDPDYKHLHDFLNDKTFYEPYKQAVAYNAAMKDMPKTIEKEKSMASELYEGFQNQPQIDPKTGDFIPNQQIHVPKYYSTDWDKFTDMGSKYDKTEAASYFNEIWGNMPDQEKAQILLSMGGINDTTKQMFQNDLRKEDFRDILENMHGSQDSLKRLFVGKAKQDPKNTTIISMQEKRENAALPDIPSIYADDVKDRVQSGKRDNTSDLETWNDIYGSKKTKDVIFGKKGEIQHATFGHINNTKGASATKVSDKDLSNALIRAWRNFGSLYNTTGGQHMDVNADGKILGSTDAYVGLTELSKAGISQKQIDRWVKDGILVDVGGISTQINGPGGLVNEKLSDHCYKFFVDISSPALTRKIKSNIPGTGTPAHEGNVVDQLNKKK